MLLLSVDVFLPPVDVFLSAAVLSSDNLSEDLSDAVFALSELPAAGTELSFVSDCVPLFCLLSLSTTFVSFNASFFTSSSVSLSATISCVFSVTLTDRESFFFPFSPDFELTATAVFAGYPDMHIIHTIIRKAK